MSISWMAVLTATLTIATPLVFGALGAILNERAGVLNLGIEGTMYAGAFVQIAVPPQQLRGAGELMYYGGDVAELLIALALVTTWRHRRRSPRLAGATASVSVRTADRQTDGGDHRPVADGSLIPRASGEVETGAARGG